MTPDNFNALFEAMEIMEAQRQLNDFLIADWPNMKEKRRSDVLKEINKKANALKPKKNLRFTAEALKEIINGR